MKKNTTDIPLDTFKLYFNYSAETFAESIKYIDIEIKTKLEKYKAMQERGVTDLCNYETVFLDDYSRFYPSTLPEKDKIRKTIQKAKYELYSNCLTWDIEDVVKFYKNSKLIGKKLSVDRDKNIIIARRELSSAKTIKKRVILFSILRELKAKRKDKAKNIIISRIKCSQVELYLKGKLDAETLFDLILDVCTA